MTIRRRQALAALPVAVLAGCAKPRVQTVEPYAGSVLPRPDRVLVAYFSVTPEEIRLDQGISARVRRAFNGEAAEAGMMQAARDTQTALAQELVDRLRRFGLPAELGGATGGQGTAMLVAGQIVSVDQGNRTRRTLIGLGAGRSTITADTQLYYAAGVAQPRFLTAFEGEADSGRMPGAAETMGAGAAAQRLATSAALTAGTHVAGETRRASGTAEAGNLAKALADRIGQFAMSQGWIPAGSVR